MSRIFSTSSGSGETLKASSRQGFRPKARQISETVWRLIPCFFARPLVDQCVASDGADSKVSTTTASTTSSPMLRTAPGRGASTSPSRRWVAKRWRHFPTVTGFTPEVGGDLAISLPIGTAEDDPAAKGEGLGRGVSPRPALESLAFLVGEGDLNGRSSATRHGRLLLQGFYQLERAERGEIPDSD